MLLKRRRSRKKNEKFKKKITERRHKVAEGPIIPQPNIKLETPHIKLSDKFVLNAALILISIRTAKKRIICPC